MLNSAPTGALISFYFSDMENKHQRRGVDFVAQIRKAAEGGKLVVVNESKAKDMLATIGVQPSEVSNILNLAKNSLSQSDLKSNPSDKKTMNQSCDADYLSALNRGDMQAAQRMVDEAAKAAGLHQCRFSTNRLS